MDPGMFRGLGVSAAIFIVLILLGVFGIGACAGAHGCPVSVDVKLKERGGQ